MERVVLLNADWSYLDLISWKRALNLMIKGKAEIIAKGDNLVCNYEGTCVFEIPKVMRLIKIIRTIYRNKVPFTKKNVLVRDDYTCRYCGKKSRKMTIDHVLPKSRGGKDTFENCVASCTQCNCKKGDKLPSEAKMHFMLRTPPRTPTVMEFLIKRTKQLGINEILRDIGVY